MVNVRSNVTEAERRNLSIHLYPIILFPFIPRGLIAVFRLQVDKRSVNKCRVSPKRWSGRNGEEREKRCFVKQVVPDTPGGSSELVRI